MSPHEADELRALGERLIAIADGRRDNRISTENGHLVEAAQREVNRRRSRRPIEEEAKIGDPGWDMLLDLYVMEAFGRRVSITSAAIAANMPLSTGLRYIGKLIESGFAYREQDGHDARRTYLRLSFSGKDVVERAMRVATEAEAIATSRINPRGVGQSAAGGRLQLDFSAEALVRHCGALGSKR